MEWGKVHKVALITSATKWKGKEKNPAYFTMGSLTKLINEYFYIL